MNQGITSVISSVFSSAGSYDLYSVRLGDRSRAGIHLEREVFDNSDVLGTWTVIDRARIRADGAPLGMWTTFKDSSTTGLGSPYASFIFEPQLNLEWSDVRQVTARHFPKLDERHKLEILTMERDALLEKLNGGYQTIKSKAIKSDDEKKSSPPAPDPAVNEVNPYTPIFYIDPSIRARFSRFLNIGTFPLRTPLSVKAVQNKMEDGEVISWSFAGRVEVGAEVGWKFLPNPGLQTAGVSYRLTGVGDGGFRISVLRENAHYAKVKLSTVKRVGLHNRMTSGFAQRDAFKGVLVLKGTRFEQKSFLAQNLNLVPYEFDDVSLRGRLFDIGYRYDLDSPDGAEAYDRAMSGTFSLSEEFASRDAGKPCPSVEKIFERKAKTNEEEHRKSADIALIMKYDHTRKLNMIDAEITLPDGRHHVFRSVAERQDRLRTWLSTNDEKISRKISVVLDANLYEKKDPASLFIIGETQYDDSATSGKALMGNIAEIENFTGKPSLFPEVSPFIPRSNGEPNSQRLKRATFGRSSFYWGFHFQRPDVERFLEVRPEQRAALVERLIRSGKRSFVLEQWEAAARAHIEKNPEQIFYALKVLFGDRSIGRSLMLLLRASLAERPLDYFVTASNASFGRIQEHGLAQTSVDKILILTEKAMGFEGYSKYQNSDAEAITTDLTADKTSEGFIRIRFNLKEDAQVLFFRISRPKEVMGARDLTEVVYSNQISPSGKREPLFHKGPNTLILDPNSDVDLAYRLSTALKHDRAYLFQVSYSRDAKIYGAFSGTSFRTGAAYVIPAQNAPLEKNTQNW